VLSFSSVEKELDLLMTLLADSFDGCYTEAVEELFTMLLETKAGIRS